MQAGSWKQRTKQLGIQKLLETHIPTPSNKSSTHTLIKQSIFREYLRLKMLSAFITIARSCPAMPYQTTGRPETPTTRSSRTGATFPSDY